MGVFRGRHSAIFSERIELKRGGGLELFIVERGKAQVKKKGKGAGGQRIEQSPKPPPRRSTDKHFQTVNFFPKEEGGIEKKKNVLVSTLKKYSTPQLPESGCHMKYHHRPPTKRSYATKKTDTHHTAVCRVQDTPKNRQNRKGVK